MKFWTRKQKTCCQYLPLLKYFCLYRSTSDPLWCLKAQVLLREKNCNLLCVKPIGTDSSKEMSAMSLGFIEVFVLLTIKL